MKRQLNVRLAVGTLIAVAVLGPAAYFWREFQVKRTAGAFLSRADSLEGEENWTEAASYLFRYLQLHPEDVNARICLAEAVDKSASEDARRKSRAVDLYFQALSEAPPERELALRGRLGELLLELQRFLKAEEEAEKLIKEYSDDPIGYRVRALAHYGQYRLGNRRASEDGVYIGEEFKKALELDPGNVMLAGTFAGIYRTEPSLLGPLLLDKEGQELPENELAELADGVMRKMLDENGEDIDAYLARYVYRKLYELPGAEDALEKALEIAPDSLEALLLAANHSHQEAQRISIEEGSTEDAKKAIEGHLAAASEHYSHIISEVAPRDERAYVYLGDISLLRGNPDEAIKTWQNGLAADNADSILLNFRLARIYLARGDIEPAEEAVNALSAAADKRVAALPPSERSSLQRSISMLKAGCFAAKGEREDAIDELKIVLTGGRSSEAEVTQAFQAEMLLGNIYISLSEWDWAAAAYERAARLQPDLAEPRLAAAAAAAAGSKPETAIQHYERALALGDPASSGEANGLAVTGVQRAEVLFALARVRFQNQKRLPEEDRNWQPYLKAIGEAISSDGETLLPNAWRTDLLQADYLALVGETKGDRQQGIREAAQHLRQAEEKYPDSEGLHLGLVLGYERFGAPEDADRALLKLEGLTGKSATTYVLRSNLYSARKQYDEAREILQKGLEVLPAEDHPLLSRALARFGLGTGDVEASQDRLAALHESNPTDRGLILQLLELAFEQNDLTSVEQWERRLRDLEGPNSPFADYSKVRRLLAGVTDKKDPKFVEGVKLLSDVERRLPNWPQVSMLKAMVLQAQGERRKAIETYRDAIRLGMQTASAYERLIALLGDEGRFDEARTYLSKANQRGISSQRLGTLEIAVAAGDKKLDQAEELARVAAAENPESASAKLNHARLLVANKKPEEAEAAFQEAIKRAPTDSRTYGALFNFYLQTERKDLARQTLRKLEENVDAAGSELASALAESYERLGDIEKADANYREAQRLDPENTAIQMRLASFLTRGDKADEAEAILRDIVAKDPRDDAARYQLADILVARGGKEEWQEALKLLEQSGTDANAVSLGRRSQALLLVRRAGRENLEKARELLEELVLNTRNPADADRLLLAQVYEAETSRLQGEGDAEGAENLLEKARDQYNEVVGRTNPNPSDLTLFVEFLIRNDKTGAASEHLDRLDKLVPDNLGTMQLRARWLHGENRTQEIKPLVEGLAEKLLEKTAGDPGAEARLALSIGNVYSNVELHQEAERRYRRLVELDPTGYAPLVNVLARQDRMTEAIDVCVEAAQSGQSTRPASLLASLLVVEKASEEDYQRAEPTLKGAMEDHPNDVPLLLGLANLRVSRKQTAEADKLYQRVLELEPKNLAALNNWATLLSEMPERNEEALETINRAIELAGEQTAFLDTKGMILVYGGKPKQAVPFLETAAYSTDSDPRYHFHLAVAHVRNGDPAKARKALREANRGDLRNQFLTEKDLQLLTELNEKLSE